MPNTLLFATNNEGRIYALSTGSTVWKEFQYSGLDFKKITSVQNIIYAVGGDRQIYVLVFGLDIPIRVKEVTYENERWFPIEGFGNRLLPTDRHKFSTEDGTENRAIELIRLPSACWIWEGTSIKLNIQLYSEDDCFFFLLKVIGNWIVHCMVSHWIMMDGLMPLIFQLNFIQRNHGIHVFDDEDGFEQDDIMH